MDGWMDFTSFSPKNGMLSASTEQSKIPGLQAMGVFSHQFVSPFAYTSQGTALN